MPYTMDDFRRDYVKEHLSQLTPKERVEGLSLEERLEDVSAEQIENYLKRLKKTPPPPSEEDTTPER